MNHRRNVFAFLALLIALAPGTPSRASVSPVDLDARGPASHQSDRSPLMLSEASTCGGAAVVPIVHVPLGYAARASAWTSKSSAARLVFATAERDALGASLPLFRWELGHSTTSGMN